VPIQPVRRHSSPFFPTCLYFTAYFSVLRAVVVQWLRTGRLKGRSSPGGIKNFPFSTWSRPASYPKDTGGSYLGVKRQGRQAYHSPPTGDVVKETWVYIFTPPYVFMMTYFLTTLQWIRFKLFIWDKLKTLSIIGN
jgi:hypothetical protein